MGSLGAKVLAMYFPPSKATKMGNDIMTFGQQEFESLGEEWERFKELLRRCPHHGLEKWMLLQSFYNGLLGLTRDLLASRGDQGDNVRVIHPDPDAVEAEVFGDRGALLDCEHVPHAQILGLQSQVY
ncbi:hypothetical protein CRG98_021039 [Punica granatum]|uniref:Retrotransposon gag domain-containing protein n=1 Tax=Punica granatum TaxID=22663 RepID=A0A2I0JSX6_PUNGR|nr:hypothetical protein CRG98_021039 [Punica granatum]